MVLATRAGPVSALVTDEAVSVSMAVPRLYGASTARVRELMLSGVAVDCGNPHLVCPLPAGLDLPDLDLTRPPEVDTGFFPDGVNVELITPPTTAGHVRMRVYERGVGETRSCGSGACAAAAVVLDSAGQQQGVVVVETAGGPLTVTLTGQEAVLTGPAVLVARGTVSLGTVSRGAVSRGAVSRGAVWR
jgi:diaminopimelate epimerase